MAVVEAHLDRTSHHFKVRQAPNEQKYFYKIRSGAMSNAILAELDLSKL